MVAVSVSAQNTRLDTAEVITQWGNIGGGGPAINPDFKFQGSNSLSIRGGAGDLAIFLSDDVNTDLTSAGTYQTVMFKHLCTTPALMTAIGATPHAGHYIMFGHGSVPVSSATDFYTWNVQGSDTYPIDRSWLVEAIDPNVLSHRDERAGTPDLTITDYYALGYDQTGSSSSDNQAIDAVDVGAGLTLIGGDGASADGTWQDFSDDDWGDSVNGRYGYVRESGGSFVVLGTLIIGTATATVFTDVSQRLVFPTNRAAAGFSGIKCDLAHASTAVTWTANVFDGQGVAGPEDVRPILTVVGTTGTFTATNCEWAGHATLTLTSACTLTSCTIGADQTIQGSAKIISSTIKDSKAPAVGVRPIARAAIVADDFTVASGISGCTIKDNHIGMEIATTGTKAFDGMNFTGNTVDILNTSGGAITINATNATNNPALVQNLNGGSAPTPVNKGSAVTSVDGNTTLSTGTYLNTAAALQIVFVAVKTDGFAVPAPTVARNSVDFDLIDVHRVYDLGATDMLYVWAFRAVDAAATTTAATVTFPVSVQTAHIHACEVPTAQTGGTNGSLAVAKVSRVVSETAVTALTNTMDAFEDTANVAISCMFHSANEATTPGVSFTELADTNAGGVNRISGFQTQWRTNDNTADNTWTTSAVGVGLALEVRPAGVGSVTINTTVTVTINVEDKNGDPLGNASPTEGARVRVEKSSDGTLIFQDFTDAAGVATDSSFNFVSDTAVNIIVRWKGYVNFRTTGTITTAGLTLTAVLERDITVDLP